MNSCEFPGPRQLRTRFTYSRGIGGAGANGCWNGLAKRAGSNADGTPNFADGEPSMQRAVAFAKDIAAYKRLAECFRRRFPPGSAADIAQSR